MTTQAHNYTLINELPSKEFIMLADRLGESENPLPKKIREWYQTIDDISYGYLMEIKGEPGFLYTFEDSHMQQPAGNEGRENAILHGHRTEEGVFELLEEIAEKLKKDIIPYPIFLSRSLGFEDCHEFCIFFPVGSDVNDIPKLHNLLRTTYNEMETKKWDSFYDLLVKL